VLQPNGKLARFSDVVDGFTHIEMTKDEAIELCREDMGKIAAEVKVQAGLDDIRPFSTRNGNDSRWMDCIETIIAVHGKESLVNAFKAASTEELIPENIDEIVGKLADKPQST